MAREMVEVWNNHEKDYSEKWHEKDFTVPAGKCIVMSRHEASMFVGRNAHGLTKPKMLEIRPIKEQVPEVAKFTCMHDGEEFSTQVELDEHLKLHKNDRIESDIKCPLCSKGFDDAPALKKHILTCKG